MELAKKRALITGGTRGIGAAIAVDLAKQGASVVINGRNDDEAKRGVLDELASLDCRGHFVQGDMGVADDVRRCVNQAAEALGGLDIVVHSAGGPSGGGIADITDEQWLKTFDVHVHGAFYLCQSALPWLRKNEEGAILLVSSVAGIRGCPGAIAYGTVERRDCAVHTGARAGLGG